MNFCAESKKKLVKTKIDGEAFTRARLFSFFLCGGLSKSKNVWDHSRVFYFFSTDEIYFFEIHRFDLCFVIAFTLN